MQNNELSIYTPKTPSFAKRIAAFIVDAIMVIVLATGFGFLTSATVHYDNTNNLVIEKQIEYEILVADEAGTYTYNGKTYSYASTLESVSEEEYNNRLKKLYADEDYQSAIVKRNTLQVIITSVGIVLALTVYEFILPLLLKHGRTLGMRFFSIGYVTDEDIDVSFKNVFVRFIIGKLAIGTLIPMLGYMLIIYQTGFGIMGLIMFVGIPALNMAMILATKEKRGIHDLIAKMKPVDNNNQIYFKTLKELNKAKGKEEEDTKVGKRSYL